MNSRRLIRYLSHAWPCRGIGRLVGLGATALRNRALIVTTRRAGVVWMRSHCVLGWRRDKHPTPASAATFWRGKGTPMCPRSQTGRTCSVMKALRSRAKC